MGQALRKIVLVDGNSADRLTSDYPLKVADGKPKEIRLVILGGAATEDVTIEYIVHDAACGPWTIDDPAPTVTGNVYDDGTPVPYQ